MLLGLKRISTAFGLLALGAGYASAQAPALARTPAPAPSHNQSTADAVASALKSTRNLSAYRIEIEAREGVVTLTGSVANATQKRDAVALVGKVRGVTGVVDQIRLVDARVRPAQYQTAMGGHGLFHHNSGTMSEGAMSEGAPMVSQPTTMAPDGSPVPEGPAGMGASAAPMAGPPNYAWPSYAPTNNFSAVGYPTAYPWQAWPNIGPFYPYPEVPQDWRAVTLRWDDGIWWLDFKKNYTRPFFTPYPFGIAAY